MEGSTDRFSFEDAEHVCRIVMPIEKNVSGKQVTYKLQGKKLTLGVSGSPPCISSEPLSGNVIADECSWAIEEVRGQRSLVLDLVKKVPGHWQSLFQKDSTQSAPGGAETESMPDLAEVLVHARVDAAIALFAKGQSKEATVALRQLLKQNPQSPSARSALAMVLSQVGHKAMEQHRLDEAVELLREAVELDTSARQGWWLSTLAECYRMQSQLQQALEACTGAIQKIPAEALRDSTTKDYKDLRFAKLLRARVNSDMGHPDQSVAELREVLSLSPSDSAAKSRLADVLVDSFGNVEGAIQLLDSDVSEDPTSGAVSSHWWAAVHAGAYAASLGKDTVAQKYFNMLPRIQASKQTQGGLEDEEQPGDIKAKSVVYRMINAIRCGDTATADKLKLEVLTLGLMGYQPLVSSWSFIRDTKVGQALDKSLFYGKYSMLHLGMAAASLDGLVLEFGVFHGASLRIIASCFHDKLVHGFDTFTGLPEDWNDTPAGSYSTQGVVPNLPNNVELHAGLFKDSLPGFLAAHPGPIRFVNFDCDLYSSTKEVLDQVFARVAPGTVIAFDEYVGYPKWQQNEFRAFQEAAKEHGWSFEYLGISLLSNQAVVRISPNQGATEEADQRATNAVDTGPSGFSLFCL